MNMEQDFRNVVENSIKNIKDSGADLTSGIILLYGNNEKETNFVRLMATTSEDKSGFVQNAITIAKRAGLDPTGIEGELGHLFFCECLRADMVERASKSLEEKLYARQSSIKKEHKKFTKFLHLMSRTILNMYIEKDKKEESVAGAEASKNNRKEGE